MICVIEVGVRYFFWKIFQRIKNLGKEQCQVCLEYIDPRAFTKYEGDRMCVECAEWFKNEELEEQAFLRDVRYGLLDGTI